MEKHESLNEVAQTIIKKNKKINLLYAFNGTGKTRLSRVFKEEIADIEDDSELSLKKIIYYNAFTEDLFTWDNDLTNDMNPVLKVNPDSDWIKKIIKDEGLERKINNKFREYIHQRDENRIKIESEFNSESTEVRFYLESAKIQNIKISRGEESVFIWAIFYVYLEYILEQLNQEEEDRTVIDFNQLKYIYIDDPVSSLDDRRIVEIAVDLVDLVDKVGGAEVKFLISTHHGLFYNVIVNEFNNKKSQSRSINKKDVINYILNKEGEQYMLEENSRATPFAYHHILIRELADAIKENRVEKYHFNLLRNVMEKTATFLGYKTWGDCIFEMEKAGKFNPDTTESYISRIKRHINLNSHSAHSEYESRYIPTEEKNMLALVFNNFIETFKIENSRYGEE